MVSYLQVCLKKHVLNCEVNLLELGLENPLYSNTLQSIFLQ